MVWVKLDDAYDEHPKIIGLSDKAFRAHVSAMCYCGRNLTDGLVPKAKIPRRVAAELEEAGLIHCENKGYRLHDWLEHNPSADEVEEKRRVRAESGRKGGKATQAKRQANAQANASASAQAKSKEPSTPNPNPNPHASTKHEEPPKPPKGGRVSSEDIDAVLAHYRTYHPRAKGDKKGRAKIAARLKDKFTVAELQQAIDGNHRSPWHCGQNPAGDRHHKVVTIFKDADQVNKFIEIAERPTQVPTNTRSARNMAVLSDWLKRGEAHG